MASEESGIGKELNEGLQVGNRKSIRMWPAQRLEMMWQLKLDAWAFKGESVAELRLPRLLCAFPDEKVEFMLVGAYAVAAHGLPRATGDIDLWIRCSNDNAGNILR